MRSFLLLLISTTILGSCTPNTQEEEAEPQCSTTATVRNLTGLDGCSYVLELGNGQRLEPRGDVWQEFTKTDGQRVQVSYREVSSVSICMVGKVVELDCITPEE
jgi:hypothetical protein